MKIIRLNFIIFLFLFCIQPKLKAEEGFFSKIYGKISNAFVFSEEPFGYEFPDHWRIRVLGGQRETDWLKEKTLNLSAKMKPADIQKSDLVALHPDLERVFTHQ